MENNFNFENACFAGKGHQSLHIYVMRIRKMLISYIKLDHTLYSNNYGIHLLYVLDSSAPSAKPL